MCMTTINLCLPLASHHHLPPAPPPPDTHTLLWTSHSPTHPRRRNFADYFNFEAGTIRAGNPEHLSSKTQREIFDWIKKNEGEGLPGLRALRQDQQPVPPPEGE